MDDVTLPYFLRMNLPFKTTFRSIVVNINKFLQALVYTSSSISVANNFKSF